MKMPSLAPKTLKAFKSIMRRLPRMPNLRRFRNLGMRKAKPWYLKFRTAMGGGSNRKGIVSTVPATNGLSRGSGDPRGSARYGGGRGGMSRSPRMGGPSRSSVMGGRSRSGAF
jgi:hypothetical protein